jgi:chromosome condensin MukBEF complex kleisin-like MukF subunit
MAAISITANNESRNLSLANVGHEVDVKRARAENLCQDWSAAKSALEIMLETASPWLKVAIDIVAAAGDTACSGG